MGIDLSFKFKGFKEVGYISKFDKKLSHLKKNQILIRVSKKYFRPNDVYHLKARDFTKAYQLLKWKLTISLNKLIDEMIHMNSITMNDLTLIIPAKNEIESIDNVLDEVINLKQNLKVLVIVDDVDDNTFESKYYNVRKLENLSFIISKISLYSGAVRCSVEKSETKFCCIFNADGSFLPSSLEDMYTKTSTI